MARNTRGFAAVAATATLLVALTACGTPPWEQQGASGGGSATPSSSPTRITVIHNDLQTGSVKRTLQAGDIRLDVNYYSGLDIGQWYADADKPLSLSASATLGTDQGQAVYLSKVTIATTVTGPKGQLTAPPVLVDQPTVSPGYFIKAPYAYGPTFIIPPLPKGATSITLSIVYELLLQTTPQSASYAKQSASDTLTIAIAKR